jgi:putative phage-type endonuclease
MGKITFVATKDWPEDKWLKYRKNGVGASEIGIVLGLSSYQSSIGLFYEKISMEVAPKVENIFMFMGKQQEDFIATLWQYWDGSEESMILNYYAGKIIRQCKEEKGYIRNSDYPQLFVSLDRIIMYAREVLECKTISGYESNKWVSGIPPSHLVQVQGQLMVTTGDAGEIAILKDGRRFEVFRFERNDAVCATIHDRTADFWKRVLRGREIAGLILDANQKFNLRIVEELTEELHSLEPPPDGSDAYQEYLKDRFKIDNGLELIGSGEMFESAVKHRDYGDRIKELQEYQRKEQNYLCREMGDKNTITFGDNGTVTWKADSKGTRRFHNGIK